MSASLPTGIVTFLFTDIEGSTRLWERAPERMRAALAIHDRLLRQAIETNDGHVVKMTGDGVMAAFGSPSAAVAAALAAQRALLATTAPLDTVQPNTDLPETDQLIPLRARMGIHTGAAELREDDYHGPTLNRAARLMAAGHGGQMLLSGITAALLEGNLPAGVTLRPLGEHRLRDLSQPERVFQLMTADLPCDFPPLRVAAARINLPQPPTGFIGRGEEVNEIMALLTAPEVRLVSLVGPGGIGKTRLAVQAAATLAEREPDRFADGVFFAPLAHLNAAAAMVAAVAEAIGVRFAQGEREPREQLLDYLRRRRMLLILDNMEQLLDDGGAALPADLLATAPGVRVLTTSRIRLGIQGEQLYLVPGMSLPERDAVRLWADPLAAEAYSGLRLFTQAAGRVQPGFGLNAGNVAAITRICRQVQGMPLGIELAAGWLELLTPEEIAAELDRSLDLLATDLRDVPTRQRSLRAVFETTWQLSSERERALLPPLSIFRAPFSREAAAAVAGAGPGDLLALVNKSWLQRVVGGDGVSRFQMHELLRQYAAERLRADGQDEAAHERYAGHYVIEIDRLWPELTGAGQKTALAVLAADYPHFRRVWEWLSDRGHFERLVKHMLLPLQRFAQMRGLLREVSELITTALEACRRAGDRCPPSAQAALLVAGSMLHYGEADLSVQLDEAWQLAQEIESPERDLGGWYALLLDYRRNHDPNTFSQLQQMAEGEDEELAVFASELIGRALMQDVGSRSTLEQSIAWFRRARDVYDQRGDQWATAGVCQLMAVVQGRLGHYSEASSSLDCADETYVALKDWQNVANIAFGQRSTIALRLGRPDIALHSMQVALDDVRAHGDRVMEALGLGQMSIALVRYGSIAQARTCREKALALVRELGHRSNEPWNLWELGEVHRVAGSTAEARRYYDEALTLFRAQSHGFGVSYFERGLGDLALMTGDYDAALRHFTTAQAQMSEYPDQIWSWIYVSMERARALIGRGQPDEALQSLREVLPMVATSNLTELEPVLLATIADMGLAAGRADAAAMLCGLLAHHPLTWNETRPLVNALAARAQAALGDEAAGAAQARGRSLDAAALIATLATLPPDLDAWLDAIETEQE